MERHFDVGSASCSLEVVSSRKATGERDEKVDISCAGKTMLIHDLGDGSVLNVSVSVHDPLRIAVNWERGTGAGITVFSFIEFPKGIKAKVAFESFSKCGAESYDDNDILLAHVGRRFLSTDSFIVPKGTNVYRWKDGAYVFQEGLRWNSDAPWDARYCVLSGHEACPAERTNKLIPDEY